VPEQLGLLEDDRPKVFGSDEAPVVIRPSRRARRLTLKVVPPFQIELVVPRGARPADIQSFLSSSREWIQRARAELEARYPPERRSLPTSIELEAIDARWAVDVVNEERANAALAVHAGRLELRVPSHDQAPGFEALRKWLLAQGRAHLRPWLAAEAGYIGVSPNRVQIRTQRTRWGSCSEHGNISLNAALLLLPKRLVRYLLVHELCHLRHLNHSKRYWRFVAEHDPGYREHDAALAAAWTEIPVWALPN
jgi:predicted metal-dependent hydrolase